MNKTNKQYVTAKEITDSFSISKATLRNWANQNTIATIRTPGNQKRLYNKQQLFQLLGYTENNTNKEPDVEKKKICYTRVSSQHQKQDLERQIQFLATKFPQHEIISDIASGINYNRKGFLSILERAFQRNIDEVTVTHKDRLCRYGMELVQFIFKHTNVKLVVLHEDDHADKEKRISREEEELAQDLLAIVNVFVARNNGLRSGQNRRKRKRDEERNEEQKIQDLSQSQTDKNTEKMVRSG